MAIFFNFNARLLADNLPMVEQGFIEYPALNGDGSPHAAPNFRTSGGGIIQDGYFGATVAPRLVKRLGSPIVRGETRIRLGEKIMMLFSDDARECLMMERGFFNGTTHSLELYWLVDGVSQPGTFYYFCLYDGVSTINQISTLPTEADVAWVVDDDELQIHVNGVQQKIRDFIHGGYVDSVPIPENLLDSDGAGYMPYFTSTYAYPLVLRDNANLLYCTDAKPVRATSTLSKLNVTGICTKTGVTNVNVTVVDGGGTSIYAGSAPVEDGEFQISTGNIPKSYEPATFVCNLVNGSANVTVVSVRSGALKAGQVLLGAGLAPNVKIDHQTSGPAGGAGVYVMTAQASQTANSRVVSAFSELKVTATNVSGSPEPRVLLAPVKRTLAQQAIRLGNNLDLLDYYTGWWPFNDLGKVIQWRTPTAFIMPVWANSAHFNADNGYGAFLAASVCNLAPNGSPRKFPDSGADLQAQLPWFPEPGDYVMDMTQAPDLVWSFSNTAGKVTTVLDHYGAKLHKITISEPYIPTAGGDGWRINLVRDNAKANKGMPSVSWNLSIRKVSTDPNEHWNASFLDYVRQSGWNHIRWMSGMMSIEPAHLPRNITTASIRCQLTDQSWASMHGARPQIPFELIVDLHNKTRKHLWLNLPRTADETYIRAIAGIVRDRLDPTLKFIWTMSNEVWNFGQRQVFEYRADGLKRGLGKGRTCTANITAGSNVIDITTATYGPVVIGQYVTGSGIPANTTITGLGTGTGRTGTYTMSANATQTATIEATYDAAVFGGDGDYDITSIPSWTSPMTVASGAVIQSFNIYRARSALTNPADPASNTDWSKWDLVQSGDHAARRSHIEQIIAVKAIIADEMGAGLYAARCQLVAESWEAAFDTWISTYLDWGNLRTQIVALCGATYFGNANPIFQWGNASQAVKGATRTLAGAARIAVWVEAAKAEALNIASTHAFNAGRLVDALEARGMAEGSVQYWTYEGGPEYSFAFANADLGGDGPIDQTALRTDILAFHRTYHGPILRTFYEAIFDVCGGTKTHFDSFTPVHNLYQVNTSSYLFWGISRDMYDRAETSSKYRELRDLSLEYGGGQVVAPPASTRRRRLASVQLS